MNCLYESGQPPGTITIMLIPSTIPEAGVPLVGFYGLKKIEEEGKRSSEKTIGKEG